MDSIWRTLQVNGFQAAIAALILCAGLYGLRIRNWSRQKQKFLREFNVAPAEVEALFRPTQDKLCFGLRLAGSAAMAIGGGIFLYSMFFTPPPPADEILPKVLGLCMATFFICAGALLAFKNQTMRQVARLSNLDNFRPGRSLYKSIVGDPMAKRPILNGYARYRGFIWFIAGLVMAYGILQHFFPFIPALD